MKGKIQAGIGESSTFAGYHPAVNFIYFVFVIGITMFSMDPAFLAVTLGASWTWSYILSGSKALKFNMSITIPIMIVMALINTFFVHNGATVLFYLLGNRITLEAFFFGLAGATMISSVVVWFSCFNTIMTSDKFIYLFGKAAPVLALTISMIFRFIPLLKNRYSEISMGQRCLGRHGSGKTFDRMRQTAKETSILISWSLEASIETSDSMEARGYGLKGRTSFHLFKFTRRDKRLLLFILLPGILTALSCFMNLTTIYYYPTIRLGQWGLWKILTLLCYGILLSTPAVIDLQGEKKWRA